MHEQEHTSYLIIGGTTKAATTSVYEYLSAHPSVCVSSVKETRFFLDEDYPLPARHRYEDTGSNYDVYYGHCGPDSLRVEATPDYLYSAGTPRKIHRALPASKVLFILRDPISRLLSWFRFAKQDGRIARSMDIVQYVDRQMYTSGNETPAQHMLALQQGRYYEHIKSYLDVFGQNRVLVVFYEDVVRDPRSVMRMICTFSGIDPTHYEGYEFRVFNRTETLRAPLLHGMYKKMRYLVRNYTHDKPFIHRVLKRIRAQVEPVYLKLNRVAPEAVHISMDLRDSLLRYYADDIAMLEALMETKTPWKVK